MATYKKRGSKSKSSGTKLEQLENKSATAGVFNTLDEGASKTEQWVANNQRNIFLIFQCSYHHHHKVYMFLFY